MVLRVTVHNLGDLRSVHPKSYTPSRPARDRPAVTSSLANRLPLRDDPSYSHDLTRDVTGKNSCSLLTGFTSTSTTLARPVPVRPVPSTGKGRTVYRTGLAYRDRLDQLLREGLD
jgi:hypothetical protein